MYVQCNQMKKDYHGMMSENMRNKTKARQMDKEILKLKDLVQKTKIGFWEHQQKFQEEAHVNNERNSHVNPQAQIDANGNQANGENLRPESINDQRSKIKKYKDVMLALDADIGYYKNCLKESNTNTLAADMTSLAKQCETRMSKIIKGECRGMLKEQNLLDTR
jgi:hypothetical protein